MKTIIKTILIAQIAGLFLLNPVTSFAADDFIWTTKKSMPTARGSAAVGVVNNKIYVIGGCKSTDGTTLTTVEEYNPATDTWTTKASMPTARSMFNAGVVNNKIYAIGGTKNGADVSANLSTVEEYDPATDTWTTKKSMPTPRHGYAIGVVNNKIYVIAGWSETANSWISTVEEYDPATDTWTTKANTPTARRWMTASTVNNKIYVIGGQQNSYYSKTEEYNPATNTWTTKANMPTARCNLVSGVINNKIYAIGGNNSIQQQNAVEEYDPVSNTWTIKTSIQTGRCAAGTGVVNNKIYVIGGAWGTTAYDTAEEGTLTNNPPADITPANITHTPVADGQKDNLSIKIQAQITDNVAITSAVLGYREAGTAAFTYVAMTRVTGTDTYYAYIYPYWLTYLKTKSVEYFIDAIDSAGNFPPTGQTPGTKENPNKFTLTDVTPPEAVYTFSSIPLADNRIKLNWSASYSIDTSKYNLYGNNGSGEINYTQPIAVIAYPACSYTTGILSKGTVYKYVLRVQDTSGNEEKNTNIYVATVMKPGENLNNTLIKNWSYQFGRICGGYYRMTPGPSAAVADLRKDLPGLEIATGNEEYYPTSSDYTIQGRWFLFNSNGSVIWSKNTENDEAHSSVVIGDANDDGNLEMGGGTTSGNQIQLIDPVSANWVWRYIVGSHVISTPAMGQIDKNTPQIEVAAGCFDGYVRCLDGKDGTLKWQYYTGAQIWSSVAIDDVDNDGVVEVIIGANNNYLYCLNGNDGSLQWKYNAGYQVRSSVAIYDFDGDGIKEIITPAYKKFVCLNGNDASVKWTTANGGDYNVSSPAIADLDADGSLEIVCGSEDGKLYCMNGSNGTLKWTADLSDAIYSSPAIAKRDLSSSKLDIYIISYSGYLHTIKGTDGSIIDKFRAAYNVVSSPIVADVDGDGKLEVFFQDHFASINGNTGDYFWSTRDTASNVEPYSIEWQMFRSNKEHTGVYKKISVPLPAPTGVYCGWGWTSSDDLDRQVSWNTFQNANLKAYRVYVKYPNASDYIMETEVPADFSGNQWTPIDGGYKVLTTPTDKSKINYTYRQKGTAHPVGKFSFIIRAVDTAGIEGNPSAIAYCSNAGPLDIISVTGNPPLASWNGPLDSKAGYVNITIFSKPDSYATGNSTILTNSSATATTINNSSLVIGNTYYMQVYKQFQDPDGGLTASINKQKMVFCLLPKDKNGCIAYWNFDEGSGTTTADIINGYDGTVTGAGWVDGKVGKALSFDGNDDYVGINSAIPVNTFTFMCWVDYQRPVGEEIGPKSYGSLISNINGHDSRNRIMINKTSKQVYCNFFVNGNFVTITSDNNLNWEGWHHITVSFDNVNFKIYYDGTLVKTVSAPGNLDAGSDASHIGALEDDPGWYLFKGNIDEVGLYNKALTEEEIKKSAGLNIISEPPADSTPPSPIISPPTLPPVVIKDLAAPTAAISITPAELKEGGEIKVTVTGTDDKNLSAIWWWGVGTGNTEMDKAHWHSCSGTSASNVWTVSIAGLAPGTYKLGANARDAAYPVAGEAHQASEGNGIAYANFTVTPTVVDGKATATIKIPTNGKKLHGNAVTIMADTIEKTAGVLFQYKSIADDSEWTDITSIDKKHPYSVYWNVSALKNGEYRLRAVAYDENETPDADPAYITIYIDDVNADIVEDGNPEVDPNNAHKKEVKISKNENSEIIIADGAKVSIPKDALNGDTSLVISVPKPQSVSAKLPSPDSSLKSAGIYYEFTFKDGTTKFNKDISITIPYPDENEDGIVDGTNINEKDLKLYYYDEETKQWKPVKNIQQVTKSVAYSSSLKAPIAGNCLKADVDHFTLFALFAVSIPEDISNLIVYPNPYIPDDGNPDNGTPQDKIKFDGLTAQAKLLIYTLTGRLVREIESNDTGGIIEWDVKNDNGDDVVTGVYIYMVTNNKGQKVRGKVAIIR